MGERTGVCLVYLQMFESFCKAIPLYFCVTLLNFGAVIILFCLKKKSIKTTN